jgi:glycine oxidase
MGQPPKEHSYDVVVIGAGVIGLSCAWRIAASGLSVAVIDRAGPGAGASGVAAGMLAPATEADFGGQGLLALNLASAARWPGFGADLSERSGREAGHVQSGALTVAVDRDDAEELARLHAFQLDLDLDARMLTRSECRELEPGLAPGIAGGVLTPEDGFVEPRALAAALAVAIDADGGELIIAMEPEIEVTGGRVTGVQTLAGPFKADNVVLAAGAWSAEVAGLPPEAIPPVRAVKGQILRLRASGAPPASRILRTPRCYIVPRAGGEVVIGATMEERGDSHVTAGGVRELLEAAWEVLPETDELKLAETAAGLRPATPDGLPLVGRSAIDGLILATGHHRNGILLAPSTADGVAALCNGQAMDTALAACDPARLVAAPRVEASP